MTPEEIEALKKSAAALEAKNKELLEEKKKEKERADKAEADRAAGETQRLKEAGDYKTLAEKLEADKKASDERALNLEKQKVAEIKKGAFSTELDKLGINPERKSFIINATDVSALQYVEAGNVVLGAEAKAKEILAQMPEIFGSKNNNLPGQGGGAGGTHKDGAPAAMTPEWFKSLSIADQDKNREAYYKANGIPYKPKS